jgi:hypothetical protein
MESNNDWHDRRHRYVFEPVVFLFAQPPASMTGALRRVATVIEHPIPVPGHGSLRFTKPFTPTSLRPGPAWHASARLYGHGLRLARYTTVEIEIAVWSDQACELQLRPLTRYLARWGTRRQRRYFALAHQAARELASVFTVSPT